jgi:hypothetical protein
MKYSDVYMDTWHSVIQNLGLWPTSSSYINSQVNKLCNFIILTFYYFNTKNVVGTCKPLYFSFPEDGASVLKRTNFYMLCMIFSHFMCICWLL